MPVLSVLRRALPLSNQLKQTGALTTCIRQMGGGPRAIVINPSRWQWHKFKDLLHFYTLLGAIPLALLTFYCNVFIGPSKLVDIPEDYEPKEYEYYSHPITRFIVKHFHHPYQEEYEKKLHIIHVHEEMRQMCLLENKVKLVVKQKEDVQGYTYAPIVTKYHKRVRQEFEDQAHSHGSN